MEWSGDYGTSNQYIAYQIGIEETDYSVSDNTSTFRTQIFIYRINTGYTTYGSGTVYYRLKTSVGDVSDWYTYNLTTDDKITSDGIYVAEDTWGPRIHNAEGDLDVTLECYIEHDTFSSDSNEFTISTTHIPRASQPSLDTSNVDFGDDITIYTNRASDNFTHHLYYSFNSGDEVGITEGFADSYTWTVPTDLMNKIPNNTSASITFYLYTFGDSLIGCKTITFTATVSSSVAPEISAIECRDPFEYETAYGAYVQNKSKVKVTVTAAGCYSSTIKSYKITANGENYAFNGATTDVLTKAGTNTINVTVTDSRGRTITKTVNINVIAYSTPVIEVLTAYRCTSNGTANEEGAYIKVIFNALITALNNKNSKTFTLQYKIQNAAGYTTHTTYTRTYTWNSNVIIAADVDNAYDIQLVAVDDFGTTTKVIQVSTAFTLIDFRDTGRGVAFGKVSEKDEFECVLPAEFKKIRTFDGVDLDKDKASKTIIPTKIYSFDKTSSASTRTIFDKTINVKGIGFIILNAVIRCDSTNDYGSTELNCLLDNEMYSSSYMRRTEPDNIEDSVNVTFAYYFDTEMSQSIRFYGGSTKNGSKTFKIHGIYSDSLSLS